MLRPSTATTMMQRSVDLALSSVVRRLQAQTHSVLCSPAASSSRGKIGGTLRRTVCNAADSAAVEQPAAEGGSSSGSGSKEEGGKLPKAAKSSNGKGGGAKQQKGGGKGAQSTSSDEDIRKLRIQKAAELRSLGKNPYAYNWTASHSSAQLQQLHADLGNGEERPEAQVSVAGRVMARRVMGKLAFIRVKDAEGEIQLYVDKAALEEAGGSFSELKSLSDIGDIVGAAGSLRRTDKGELSVVVKDFQILTKSLLPLPDKWHGLQDVEKRYRQRYVDMIMNAEVVNTFKARARITSCIRRLLEDRGFLEVETPVLEAHAGGADARPFSTYHNALGRPFTLRIATELHLKRLVVGGLDKVFEIGRIFRNEGISTRHNPEFTSIELYQAYADYHDMMAVTEEIIR